MKWFFIIIALIIIGYYVYKLIPFNYTPNVPPLLNISKVELEALHERLKSEDLTESERQETINRQEEIYNLLRQFYGN